ncbi:hypothetical protein [Francisella sp. 19X1-34]|uniref:hypothetical protein n=1 Tax=Francisella sp. 19X1-34 TaxID=3087177 RepID=UPI002E304889|nr:hypothetical protein [Francisella sp. 19X1-34]MED7789172.1 hypothetical protein [Francisella sp. 19X1-34]
MDKLKISFAEINKLSTDQINDLQKLINDAYKIGEGDLWVESAQRVSFDELKNAIEQNKIIIAQNKDIIITSVRN